MSLFMNDVGIKFLVETNYSLSQVTRVSLLYRTPSGRNGSWTGDVINGTQILYTTQAGDLSEAGVWQLQAQVVTPTTTLRGEKTTIKVSSGIQL